MKSPRRQPVTYIMAFAILAAAIVLVSMKLSLEESVPEDARHHENIRPDGMASTRSSGHRVTASEREEAALQGLRSFAARFQSAGTVAEQRAIYAEFVQSFLETAKREDHEGMGRIIRGFLATGADAETGMPFAVGRNGLLESADSLRDFMLDKIQMIDPAVALDLSRDALNAHKDQGECAIALRNLVKADKGATTSTEIDEAFQSMMSDQNWRTSPEIGFFEAFDIAVGSTSEATVMSVLDVLNDSKDIDPKTAAGHINASTLALDRIMQTEPEIVLGLYLADPSSFLANQRERIPDLMSRVNVTTETGRESLRVYLKQAEQDGANIQRFLAIYPNGSYFTGNRLTSTSEVDTKHNIYRTYRDSYALIEQMAQAGEISESHATALLTNLARYFPKSEFEE